MHPVCGCKYNGASKRLEEGGVVTATVSGGPPRAIIVGRDVDVVDICTRRLRFGSGSVLDGRGLCGVVVFVVCSDIVSVSK